MPESTLEYQASQAAASSSSTYSDGRSPQANTPKPRQPEDTLISVFENCIATEKWKEEKDKLFREEIADLFSKLESATEEETTDLPLLFKTFLGMSQAWTTGAQLFERGAHLVQERMNSQYPELYTAILKLSADDFYRIYTSMKRNVVSQVKNELFPHHESSSDYQNGNLSGAVSLAPDSQASELELLQKADKPQAIFHHSPPSYNEANNLEMDNNTRTLNAQIKPHRVYWRRILNLLRRQRVK
ncbi:hypothetical protein N7540_003338 [Penicillium herquei]|nr:hypothetical protein N7540_003338 [Penicillium herquei]